MNFRSSWTWLGSVAILAAIVLAFFNVRISHVNSVSARDHDANCAYDQLKSEHYAYVQRAKIAVLAHSGVNGRAIAKIDSDNLTWLAAHPAPDGCASARPSPLPQRTVNAEATASRN